MPELAPVPDKYKSAGIGVAAPLSSVIDDGQPVDPLVPGVGVRNVVQKSTIEVMGTADANSGAPATTTTVGATWQAIYGCRSRPLAIRVVYANPTAVAYTVDKTFVKSSATYVADGDPTGSDSWVAVTFASAASIVVPAGSTTAPAQVLSDWIYIAPVSRIDAGTLPLLHVRSYLANGGATAYPYQNPYNYSTYPGNSVAGLVRCQAFQAGDTSSSNGFTGASGTGIGLHQSLQLKEAIRSVRLASVGDSLEYGNTPAALPSNGGYINTWIDQAVTLVNAIAASGVVFSHVNCGVGGQTVAQYLGRLAQVLTNMTPDVVQFAGWSINGLPGTQAAYDAQIGLVVNAINAIVAAGAVPLIRTAPPYNAATVQQEAFRVATNKFIRGLPKSVVLVSDVDAAVAGASIGGVVQWNPAYGGDGIHPNAAGEVLWAQINAATLSTLTVL